MKEKIIEMLSNGIPQHLVASACGVSNGYVSQLMSDEGIFAQVAEAKIKNVEKSLLVDDMMDDIEALALEKMKALLPFITRPLDAARLFQTVNGAKRRTAEVVGLQNPTAPTVQINIATSAAVQFKLSSDQQVVEVDGRSLTTLPTRQLVERLKEVKESRPLLSDATTAQQMLDKISVGLPAGTIANVL